MLSTDTGFGINCALRASHDCQRCKTFEVKKVIASAKGYVATRKADHDTPMCWWRGSVCSHAMTGTAHALAARMAITLVWVMKLITKVRVQLSNAASQGRHTAQVIGHRSSDHLARFRRDPELKEPDRRRKRIKRGRVIHRRHSHSVSALRPGIGQSTEDAFGAPTRQTVDNQKKVHVNWGYG